MDPIEILSPSKEVMGFFQKYMMTGVKNLNTKEREVFTRYLQQITMERYIVDETKVNIKDLVEGGNKTWAIVRRRP